MKILVINGPNMNLLGLREPGLYGHETYNDLLDKIRAHCAKKGIEVSFFQSNHEGALVDAVQGAYGNCDGLIINAAAYAHTSIALLDAIKAVGLPAVEVHMTDVSRREMFRRTSYVALACLRTISGLGMDGYLAAIDALQAFLSNP